MRFTRLPGRINGNNQIEEAGVNGIGKGNFWAKAKKAYVHGTKKRLNGGNASENSKNIRDETGYAKSIAVDSAPRS